MPQEICHCEASDDRISENRSNYTIGHEWPHIVMCRWTKLKHVKEPSQGITLKGTNPILDSTEQSLDVYISMEKWFPEIIYVCTFIQREVSNYKSFDNINIRNLAKNI